MAGVKQVRVLRNVLSGLLLSLLILWLLRERLWEHRDALLFGGGAGCIYGLGRWRSLHRCIARRDRRYERNKIFVHALTWGEAIGAAVAYNPLLAIPLGIATAVAMVFAILSAHWWTVLGAAFALATMAILSGCTLWFEHRHGPLYYQYRSEAWSGAEGLLYQEGTVVQPLTPTGKVSIQGVLWNAVSMSGEPIAVGEQVEVLAIERLTLYVDRLPRGSAVV